MRILVSADDFGLTAGITDGILAAADAGCLSSTSVLANGDAFGDAMARWRKRRDVELTAHLNLMEGRPIAPASGIPLLVNAGGEFALSFPKLLALSMRLRGAERDELRRQIRTELDAQISVIAEAAGPGWLARADGHQHYHMIPIVLDALLDLHAKWRFDYVRVTEEPFFVVPSASSLTSYLGPNLAKHSLLRVLSQQARKRLAAAGIAHPRWFVGLLFSGKMTASPVRAAVWHLQRLQRRSPHDELLVEVLLHPGRASGDEAPRWKGRSDLEGYYTSPWRDEERSTVCSAEFRECVAPFLVRRAAAAA
jgi:hypothetical protein